MEIPTLQDQGVEGHRKDLNSNLVFRDSSVEKPYHCNCANICCISVASNLEVQKGPKIQSSRPTERVT